MMSSYKVITGLVFIGGLLHGQTSFWSTSAVPGTPSMTGTKSVTLGLKFTSDVPGSVSGLRFYKGAGNSGTHVGTVWSATGTKLAEVTFTNEKATGWQQANFSTPVGITANTAYVISYLAPKGGYAADEYYSWVSVNPSSLHISGTSPGFYTYGSGVQFPKSSWKSSNYWVDVLFNPSTAAPPPTDSQRSLWPNPTTPGTPSSTDKKAVTLGVKFYSDVPGTVNAVRFYKGTSNTGTHVGNLWSSTGSKLAEVNFTGETASGWQQANFSAPVSISANTVYTVSYLAPAGGYAMDQAYSWTSVNAAPLHLSTSSPGVYVYGSPTAFPSASWNATNYWVDLVFVPSSAPVPPTTYGISGTISGSTATVVLSGAGSQSTTTSGSYTFSGLANGAYVVTPSKSGYTFSPASASVTVNGASVSGINFVATAVPPVAHNVSLTWNGSTSSGVTGYNLMRGTQSGGPYTKVNSATISGTTYNDSSVVSGQKYYYVVTAVSSSGQSAYSNETPAQIPTP